MLNQYTKSKNIKELRSEIERARSDELAKKTTLDLEIVKEKDLEAKLRVKAN